jgi:hypothetical protein
MWYASQDQNTLVVSVGQENMHVRVAVRRLRIAVPQDLHLVRLKLGRLHASYHVSHEVEKSALSLGEFEVLAVEPKLGQMHGGIVSHDAKHGADDCRIVFCDGDATRASAGSA